MIYLWIWKTEGVPMRYAGIINNDVVNGKGVCVSFWSQGCPHRCPGCHNPTTWDFNEGLESNDKELIDHILELLYKNGVKRNLSILGGEPLCTENLAFTFELIKSVKSKYPDTKIFVWTGYSWDELFYMMNINNYTQPSDDCDDLIEIIENIDVLVDGRFEKDLRDITLPMCGSTNQRVIDVKETIKTGRITIYKESQI